MSKRRPTKLVFPGMSRARAEKNQCKIETMDAYLIGLETGFSSQKLNKAFQTLCFTQGRISDLKISGFLIAPTSVPFLWLCRERHIKRVSGVALFGKP